jgi:hypothetical protein
MSCATFILCPPPPSNFNPRIQIRLLVNELKVIPLNTYWPVSFSLEHPSNMVWCMFIPLSSRLTANQHKCPLSCVGTTITGRPSPSRHVWST